MIAFLVCWMVFKLKIGPCHLGRHSGAAASSSNLFKVKPWKKGEWLWNRISTTLRWSKTYAQENEIAGKSRCYQKVAKIRKTAGNTTQVTRGGKSSHQNDISSRRFDSQGDGFDACPFDGKPTASFSFIFFATQFSNPFKLALRILRITSVL